MHQPWVFHVWNGVGRVLRWLGDRCQSAHLRLYGWSGWTDAVADGHRR